MYYAHVQPLHSVKWRSLYGDTATMQELLHVLKTCTRLQGGKEYVLKKVILLKQRMLRRTETSVQVFWARLASFGHLGLISDPLIVSKFSNESHDPKGQENKIYTIVKGRVTFYCRHTVQIISCSEVKYVLKKVKSGMKLSLNQVWDRTTALTGVSSCGRE